jgi:hypothetical protein
MPDEQKDKKIVAEIKTNIDQGDPLTAAAVAVDNPAETVLQTAETVTTPEPVEEVIEDTQPHPDPFTAGIDRILSVMDERFNGIDQRMKALEDRPIANTQPEKKEEKENVESLQTKKRRGLRLRSKHAK